MSELPEHLRLPILLGVLLRVDDHVHPVALLANPARGDKVGAQRIIFWQVCCKVHLFPLELLAKILLARESKLAQVPALNEIDLAIYGRIVDFVRVRFEA